MQFQLWVYFVNKEYLDEEQGWGSRVTESNKFGLSYVMTPKAKILTLM